MKTCVVAGGGLVSLFAAFLLQETHDEIIIVEKSDKIGGLLSSFEIADKFYDYGTHIPALTGDPVVDGTLYGDKAMLGDTWHWFPYLKSENFFAGEWCQTSPLPAIHKIKNYDRAMEEFMALPAPDRSATTLKQYVESGFGKSIANEVYSPILHKLLGTPLDQLHPECLRIFGLQRVMALTSDKTKELKANPVFDAKLGYHSYTEGAPSSGYVYPKGERGIGTWIELLLKQAAQSGKIRLATKNTVKSIQCAGDKVSGVTLSDGEEIACTDLLWALPLPLAFLAMGQKPQGKPPQFRTTTLLHYEFDLPLAKTFPQYLLCWDPAYQTYRITLYPNISDDRYQGQGSSLTVEVLGDDQTAKDPQTLEKKIFNELKELAIIQANSKIVNSKVEYLGPTFPILTGDFLNQCQNMCQQLEGQLKNFSTIGRHSGKNFFINDCLLDAKKTVLQRHA